MIEPPNSNLFVDLPSLGRRALCSVHYFH